MKKLNAVVSLITILMAMTMIFTSCDFDTMVNIQTNDDRQDDSQAIEKPTDKGNKNDDSQATEKPTDKGNKNDDSQATEKPTDKDNKNDDSQAAESEPSFTPSLPQDDLDFEGAEIGILYRDYISNSREWYKKSPEDELDEAIAMRNEAVEETLNVKIDWQPVASNGNDYTEYTSRFHSMVQADVNSGTHYYDISANFGYPTVSPTIRDYTTNLLDTSIFPHFDFDLPCWNQAIVTNTTFNSQLFYVAGDINLSMFDAAVVVWHNKTLYDAKKEAYDPDNMQDLALDGNWTYDELYRWTSTFYENTNGNDAGRDSKDTYALLAAQTAGSSPMPRDAFPYAWDLSFVTTNNDGTHSFNIVGNTKVEAALTKCRNLLRGTGTYNTASAQTFASGSAIFYMERIYSGYDANMAIREMEDKYGLLPMPKYDIHQEQYATTAQDYYTLMFVLDHSDSDFPTQGDAVSAFLQLATEKTHDDVRSYYCNRIIKPKFFGTDDSEGTVTKSVALFDIIVANIKFDYCNIYSEQLNNINHLWRDATNPDSTNANASLETMYKARQFEFEEAIKVTDLWLGLENYY